MTSAHICEEKTFWSDVDLRKHLDRLEKLTYKFGSMKIIEGSKDAAKKNKRGVDMTSD